MKIETITLVELSLFVTSIIGAFVLCLKQSQSSKCGKINICWGLISCDRDPTIKTEDVSGDADIENNIPDVNSIQRP
jgi:hypothetical protein